VAGTLKSGRIEQGTANQALRQAIVVMLLGGVFFAVLITVLVITIWILLRYLRARESPRAI